MNKTEQKQFEKEFDETISNVIGIYSVDSLKIKAFFTTHTNQLLEKRMGEVSKLQCIFRAINSYEPDGEVNTLCEQAYPIINSIFTPPTDITNKDI